MKACYFVGLALLALSSAAVWAQAANTYRFDAMGRLTSTSSSGGKLTVITYDAAGNRSSYKISDGAAPAPTPTPAPTPAPTAAAPTALNPTLNYSSGGSYSIALSTLASTNSAALITGFAVPSGGGSASIAIDGQSVAYTAPRIDAPAMCEPATTSAFSVPYTVQNSAGGPSASGTATVKVKGPAGPKPKRGQQCP